MADYLSELGQVHENLDSIVIARNAKRNGFKLTLLKHDEKVYQSKLLPRSGHLGELFTPITNEDDGIKRVRELRHQQLATRRRVVDIEDQRGVPNIEGVPPRAMHVYTDVVFDKTDMMRDGLDWSEAFFQVLKHSPTFQDLDKAEKGKLLELYNNAWLTYERQLAAIEGDGEFVISGSKEQMGKKVPQKQEAALMAAAKLSSEFRQRLRELVILADTAEGSEQLSKSNEEIDKWLHKKWRPVNSKWVAYVLAFLALPVFLLGIPFKLFQKTFYSPSQRLHKGAKDTLSWLHDDVLRLEQADAVIVTAKQGERDKLDEKGEVVKEAITSMSVAESLTVDEEEEESKSSAPADMDEEELTEFDQQYKNVLQKKSPTAYNFYKQHKAALKRAGGLPMKRPPIYGPTTFVRQQRVVMDDKGDVIAKLPLGTRTGILFPHSGGGQLWYLPFGLLAAKTNKKLAQGFKIARGNARAITSPAILQDSVSRHMQALGRVYIAGDIITIPLHRLTLIDNKSPSSHAWLSAEKEAWTQREQEVNAYRYFQARVEGGKLFRISKKDRNKIQEFNPATGKWKSATVDAELSELASNPNKLPKYYNEVRFQFTRANNCQTIFDKVSFEHWTDWQGGNQLVDSVAELLEKARNGKGIWDKGNNTEASLDVRPGKDINTVLEFLKQPNFSLSGASLSLNGEQQAAFDRVIAILSIKPSLPPIPLLTDEATEQQREKHKSIRELHQRYEPIIQARQRLSLQLQAAVNLKIVNHKSLLGLMRLGINNFFSEVAREVSRGAGAILSAAIGTEYKGKNKVWKFLKNTLWKGLMLIFPGIPLGVITLGFFALQAAVQLTTWTLATVSKAVFYPVLLALNLVALPFGLVGRAIWKAWGKWRGDDVSNFNILYVPPRLKQFAQSVWRAFATDIPNSTASKSAYESIIAESFESCKSSLDRNGAKVELVTALYDQFVATGRMPSYNDSPQQKRRDMRQYCDPFLQHAVAGAKTGSPFTAPQYTSMQDPGGAVVMVQKHNNPSVAAATKIGHANRKGGSYKPASWGNSFKEINGRWLAVGFIIGVIAFAVLALIVIFVPGAQVFGVALIAGALIKGGALAFLGAAMTTAATYVASAVMALVSAMMGIVVTMLMRGIAGHVKNSWHAKKLLGMQKKALKEVPEQPVGEVIYGAEVADEEPQAFFYHLEGDESNELEASPHLQVENEVQEEKQAPVIELPKGDAVNMGVGSRPMQGVQKPDLTQLGLVRPSGSQKENFEEEEKLIEDEFKREPKTKVSEEKEKPVLPRIPSPLSAILLGSEPDIDLVYPVVNDPVGWSSGNEAALTQTQKKNLTRPRAQSAPATFELNDALEAEIMENLVDADGVKVFDSDAVPQQIQEEKPGRDIVITALPQDQQGNKEPAHLS